MPTPQLQTQQPAEAFIWRYCQRQLEQAGHGEAALYLRHFLSAGLRETRVEHSQTTYCFDMLNRVSEYSVELNAHDGCMMGWQFSLLSEDSNETLAPDMVLRAAREAADPPPGALLKMAEYEDIGGAPVFVARWEHEEDGIPVERDFVHIHVNGHTGDAFAVSRRWHTVEYEYTER